MKKFIFNCIVGFLIVITLDFSIGKGLEYFYFKQSSGFQYRTTYSIENADDEVLVFGSSRANHHYKPSVIEEELGVSCYNTGRDGNFIFYQTAVLKSVLERYKPKLILYDFTGDFSNNQEDYDRLSSLLPYYKNHSEIRDIVNLRSNFEPFKNLSKIYPYNSTLGNIVKGNLLSKDIDESINKGYVPLYGKWEGTLKENVSNKPYDIDPNKIKIFTEFLDLCKQNNIPVVVLVSPIFYKYERNFSIELCEKICSEAKVPFFDFTRDKYYLSAPYLFDDPDHLNDEGAKVYSKDVIETIKYKK